MAEVNATFNYDADFSSAISEVKRLSHELSVLNTSFNSLDKGARKVRDEIAQTFIAGVGDLGAFSAKTVDISSSMDHFGKSLDQGKLKLRDYYREATRAFSANSNAQRLATDQIRKTRSELVQLGIDPTGRNKGILVTPLRLDMSDMNNQMAVARKQFDIFNALVQGGATKLINFGKNTQWAGRQLTVGITVPMSIFASTVTKAFMDVDAELTRFQKVYGSGLVASTAQSTAAIRGQVTAMATDIAKQYGIAAKETAGLAADLAATGLEGQNLLDSLKQTTRLAVLGEVDRQTAMKATLAIQNAFKVNTKDLADNINFLNAVENQTSTSLQDLTEAIPKAGPVIKALGGDVKDLSLLLVAMKEGGIGVAEGANAIKSGLASLINPTKAASEAGKQYGINIEAIVKANKGQLMPTIIEFQNALNTLDDFSKAQVIEKIFGKYQFARMSALFDNLNASGSQTQKVLELMGASTADLAGIANQEIKTLTESASMRFKRSMEAIRASLLPVGEAILKSVLPYLEKFSGFIDRVVQVGKNLPEPIKQFIKFGTAITAIAGPLVMIGGVLANFLGYVQKGAMGFVNLGRRMAGLPTQQFSLLNDEQIAAAKATDLLTISIDKQKSAMIGLNALMKDYVATLVAQRELTPFAFNPISPTPSQGGVPVVPKGAKTLPIIRRQSGGSAWVPGSGEGDRIPALLEPGEFVINKKASAKHSGILEQINSGTPRFQNGGMIHAMAGFTPRRPVPKTTTPMTAKQKAEAAETAKQAAANETKIESQKYLDIDKIALSIKQKQGGGKKGREVKIFDPKDLIGLAYGENRIINDLFRSGNPAIRSQVVDRILRSENLNIDQKRSILSALDSEANIKGLDLRRAFSSELETLWAQGTFRELSVAQQLQLATMIQAPKFELRNAKTFLDINPDLKPLPGRGKDGRSNPFTREITRESFLSPFKRNDSETDQVAIERLTEFEAAVRQMVPSLPTKREIRRTGEPRQVVVFRTKKEKEDEYKRLLIQSLYGRKDRMGNDVIAPDAAHIYGVQSGGMIHAMSGIKVMPETWAKKLTTFTEAQSKAHAEAQAITMARTELGTRVSSMSGMSSIIPGVNGVYEVNGKRYVVKGHDTYDSALAEANGTKLMRDVFGLHSPNQEVVKVKHPNTGQDMFAVRSPYEEKFAKSTGKFDESNVFDQIVASTVRRDKDLQADNFWGNIVADVGQAGIMSKASQPRAKTGATNSVLEQLAVNLGMVKGGARSHGAEQWNIATSRLSDSAIADRIKESARSAKQKAEAANLGKDYEYVLKDLDDIMAADLSGYVAHLRTVVPKTKKPPTDAALAKKEADKIKNREERQAALEAGYPEWAMQSGGLIRAMLGIKIPRSKNNTPYSGQVAGSLTPKVSKKDQDLLDLYFDKPQVGHLDNLQKAPLGEIASRGMVPSQTLYRGMSDFDMNLVKQSGTLTRDSVMSTTRDRDAAIKIASGLSDSGGGNTYSVAKIKVGRGIRGVHLNSLVPRARQSLDEILLSPQTPLHFRRSELGYRINTGESIIPVMQHVFSTKKPNMVQRLYDRILQSRQSELRPLTREEVRYWQKAGAPLTEGMQLVANRGKTIYGDNYQENYQRSQSSKRVEEAVAAERARKALLTPEESRAEYLAAVSAREARNDRGVQTGGLIYAQDGAWVPGTGSGDRVPAMLEPGEFVVNKKAAMKHGGLLSHLNWVDAPRFAQGTPGLGMKTAMGVGALGMGTMMLPQMMNMSEGMTKLVTGFTTFAFALQAATTIVQVFSAKTAMASGMPGGGIGKLGKAKQSVSFAAAAEKRAVGAAAMKGGAGGGRLAGARMFTSGLIMNPIGLTVVAAIGLAALAVMKYRKEVEQTKKAAQEAFSVGSETAAAYGVEIQKLNDKLKENQEITKAIGLGVRANIDPNAISDEQKAAILKDNQNLIDKMKATESAATTQVVQGATRSPQQRVLEVTEFTGAQKEQSMARLQAKYATLRQQGFSEDDAMQVVTQIAKESGDATLSLLNNMKPQLLKITGDNASEIFKSAQAAQLDSLKNLDPSGMTGGGDAWKEAFTASMQAIQYAPPQDQMDAMNKFILNLNQLDSGQIKLASEAMVAAAEADYGSASNFAITMKNLQSQGNATGMVVLDTAQRLGIDTTKVMLDYEISPEEQAWLNEQIRVRNIRINLEIQNKEQAQIGIDQVTASIEKQNAKFDSQLAANDAAIEKENKRYANAGKLSAKFIKQKQKEIESINKGADTYIKSLERESKQDEYIQSQRKTALSGLQALTQGDVLGFLSSKQDATAAAQQYSYDQEIQQIDDKRKLAVDALQTQIDKENERQANAEENHQKTLDNLEKQRQGYIKNNATIVSGLQNQLDAYSQLQNGSGKTFDAIMNGYSKSEIEAGRFGAVAAAVSYLLSHPDATVAEAIAAGKSFMKTNFTGTNSSGGERAGGAGQTPSSSNTSSSSSPSSGGEAKVASGGHITGAGGPTDDKIPAMLSNGEYVIRASAVDQYGVGMLDDINTQRYASGGVVRPAGGGITNHYGTRKPYYSKNKDSRGWGIHTGTDFAPGEGKPVYAFEDGDIINAGANKGWGNNIKMKHAYGPRYSFYAHLASILRKSGFVTAGTKIGTVGNTGSYSRGAHLHFETGSNLPYDRTNNPEQYLGIARKIAVVSAAEVKDSNRSNELQQIATAMGTTVAQYNLAKSEGLGSVLTGRRFGGSMTMNKPYMVGEAGPEIVTPYGFGGRVSPIKYNVPRSAMSPELMEAVNNTNIANSSSLVYNINVDASGMSDPKDLAKYIVSTIKAEKNSRSFGRGV